MKAGDVINGYTILEDFKVVGAGLSEWTFAEQGGQIYFVKRFLSPTYPDDAAPVPIRNRQQQASLQTRQHQTVLRPPRPQSIHVSSSKRETE